MHCTLYSMHKPCARTMHTQITHQAIVFAVCELALTICLTVHFITPNMVSRSGGGHSLDPTNSHVYLLIWTAAALWYAPISPRAPSIYTMIYLSNDLL